MIVLGIDPGLKGGFCLLADEDPIHYGPMPLAGKEIDVRRLAEEVCLFEPDMVVIEKVHSMPQQGVASTFTFGKGYGKLMGMVEGRGWRLDLVTPQAWKKVVLKGTKRDKDAAIEFALHRYPAVKLVPPRGRVPHDGIADAVCMAHYGLMTHG